MSFVRTVLGDIEPADLGWMNAHEHVFLAHGLILVREPEFRLDSKEKAQEEVADYKRAGGQALLDAGPLGVGRSVEGLVHVSQATGVHIIATTGFHKVRYYLDSHWRFHSSAEQCAALFISEIERGMDERGFESPYPHVGSARAGAIKVASDYQRIDADTMKAIEAAGIAHRATGSPVLTHTEMGTMAIEQLQALEAAGVPPRHVVLSHMDRNPDLSLHRELASAGAFLEYDGPGRVKYFPESTLLTLMREMFEAGFGTQVLLGGDTARRAYWKAYGGGPGMAYTLDKFVPRMRNEGFSGHEIETIFVSNAARAFAFAEPA